MHPGGLTGGPAGQHTLRGVEAPDTLHLSRALHGEREGCSWKTGHPERSGDFWRPRCVRGTTRVLTPTSGSSPTLSPVFFEVTCEDKPLGPRAHEP